jgi:GT2 family glycosyltransferase
LRYIAEQRLSHHWELVVVNNGSTDRTASVLAEYQARVEFPVTVVTEGVPGLGNARNAGCAVARGEIIAFTDDDCYVAADYVESVRAAFKDPRVGIVGGRVDLFDPSDYPMTIMRSDETELMPPGTFIFPGRLHGANMAFRRRAIEEIGGFDPDFGPGARFMAADDCDAQVRASCAGWWALYAPQVIVAHHHRRKAADMPRLWRAYGVGVGAFLAKLVLLPDTRSVMTPILLRSWYWWLWRIFGRVPGAGRMFIWEIVGMAAYVATRICRWLGRAAGGPSQLAT